MPERPGALGQFANIGLVTRAGGDRLALNGEDLRVDGSSARSLLSQFMDWRNRTAEKKDENKALVTEFVARIRDGYGDEVANMASRELRAHLSEGRPLTARRVMRVLEEADHRASSIAGHNIGAVWGREREILSTVLTRMFGKGGFPSREVMGHQECRDLILRAVQFPIAQGEAPDLRRTRYAPGDQAFFDRCCDLLQAGLARELQVRMLPGTATLLADADAAQEWPPEIPLGERVDALGLSDGEAAPFRAAVLLIGEQVKALSKPDEQVSDEDLLAGLYHVRDLALQAEQLRNLEVEGEADTLRKALEEDINHLRDRWEKKLVLSQNVMQTLRELDGIWQWTADSLAGDGRNELSDRAVELHWKIEAAKRDLEKEPLPALVTDSAKRLYTLMIGRSTVLDTGFRDLAMAVEGRIDDSVENVLDEFRDARELPPPPAAQAETVIRNRNENNALMRRYLPDSQSVDERLFDRIAGDLGFDPQRMTLDMKLAYKERLRESFLSESQVGRQKLDQETAEKLAQDVLKQVVKLSDMEGGLQRAEEARRAHTAAVKDVLLKLNDGSSPGLLLESMMIAEQRFTDCVNAERLGRSDAGAFTAIWGAALLKAGLELNVRQPRLLSAMQKNALSDASPLRALYAGTFGILRDVSKSFHQQEAAQKLQRLITGIVLNLAWLQSPETGSEQGDMDKLYDIAAVRETALRAADDALQPVIDGLRNDPTVGKGFLDRISAAAENGDVDDELLGQIIEEETALAWKKTMIPGDQLFDDFRQAVNDSGLDPALCERLLAGLNEKEAAGFERD